MAIVQQEQILRIVGVSHLPRIEMMTAAESFLRRTHTGFPRLYKTSSLLICECGTSRLGTSNYIRPFPEEFMIGGGRRDTPGFQPCGEIIPLDPATKALLLCFTPPLLEGFACTEILFFL